MDNDNEFRKNMVDVTSWGQVFQTKSIVTYPSTISDNSSIRFPSDMKFLAIGQKRSYGDSCLNHEQALINTQFLDHILDFNPEKGEIELESGVTLDQLLYFLVPRGFFIPVSPGTKFVSIGGAIANDIHGKNHHLRGCFGNNVISFELLRSNGVTFRCSRDENPELFYATIGGLGLTGIIKSCRMKIIPIKSSLMDVEIIKFSSLKDYYKINENSQNFEYTVSWVDCVNSSPLDAKNGFVRGHYIRGNHSSGRNEGLNPHSSSSKISVPFSLPNGCLNPLTISAFNHVYYNKFLNDEIKLKQHYDPFFYPLDKIHHWNRIYGNNGFYQFQCVVDQGTGVINDIFSRIFSSKQGSFLAVLKTFGAVESLGMLSFPTNGITLALDFPKNEKTNKLINNLNKIVVENGGRLYPAKDSLMTAEEFQKSFPRLQEFKKFKDENMNSSFWKRVTGE